MRDHARFPCTRLVCFVRLGNYFTFAHDAFNASLDLHPNENRIKVVSHCHQTWYLELLLFVFTKLDA